MTEKKPHPLKTWLISKKNSASGFAKANGLHFRPLYAHINGECDNPTLSLMVKIEKATAGSVTVRKQIAWWRWEKNL